MSATMSGVLLTTALVVLSRWAVAQGPGGGPSRADDGELAYNNACRTCHTLREGDNRLGPTLYKVVGRKAGSVPGYGYSSAMKDAGIVWDRDTLDRFIANPDQVVPGHNMKPYGGIALAEDRAKIVGYLEASGGRN